MEKFITPKIYSEKFTCPHCNAISQHSWRNYHIRVLNHPQQALTEGIAASICTHCNGVTLWYIKVTEGIEICIYPDTFGIPPINSEMPEEIKKLYQEAGSVFSKSPRAAAALLRLAIQKLCAYLGESGANINNDIKSLVEKGLPQLVQEALDVVRVTGNDAVHPGQIDTDDPEIVKSLFELLNIIVEYMIAMPNKTSGLFNNLPQDKKDGITNRDK